MMTLEEIQRKLEDRNLRKVAQATGLHYNTVYRLMNNQQKPSYKVVKMLSDYLKA